MRLTKAELINKPSARGSFIPVDKSQLPYSFQELLTLHEADQVERVASCLADVEAQNPKRLLTVVR